jgi:signal transduction histidine kinase/CheY-like chemotaxis protein
MTSEHNSETSVFLSTAEPDSGERKLALAVVVVSAIFFLLTIPYAKLPWTKLPAFIPMYEAALIINDIITATLLFIQFSILRSRALLILACGYLFTTCMETFHLLSFPGAFAPGGVLGGGTQTTVWIYMFWHSAFPLFAIAYALLDERRASAAPLRWSVRATLLTSIAATLLAAACVGLMVTLGHDLFPVLLQNGYTRAMDITVTGTWALSILALAALWKGRRRSVLNMWLMVVMCAWLFDIALSAVFNAARFDMGFYIGRVYGLLAASFVLIVLLLDNGRLYARLAAAHRSERQKADSLSRLSRRLEKVNTALADKSQQLQKASRLKSEFLAGMSHELRTPLNAIIGFSEVLKDGLVGELRPEQREYISDIFGSGQHLLSLINDILDLSKIEAGKMTLDFEPIDLQSLLRNGMSMIREKSAAQRIQLAIEIPETVGNIMGDARKTKQIVYNLLSNAVKFTPQGGSIALTVREVGKTEIENWSSPLPTCMKLPLPAGGFDEFIEITVADTGIGIAPEDTSRLFQAFSQLSGAPNRTAEGTGLGLVLTLKLATLQGGTVALASKPGEGTRFTVWLPRRTGGAQILGQPPLAQNNTAGRQFALVIEDNDRAAELISVQLKPAGFEVLRAATAREALDLLKTLQPHVIILDILLPDMDGWDLLALIKHPGSRSFNIPVVIVSIVADAQKGFALGAAQVLQKPVMRDDVLLALESLGLRGNGTPLKVLIVDDDPIAIELVSTYLSEPAYKVLRANGGAEGIEVCRREMPDLIVLDLLMPGVNGFEVIETLKGDPATASVPIVVLTAKTLSSTDRGVLLSGIDTILDKADLSRNLFASEVQRALDNRKGNAA